MLPDALGIAVTLLGQVLRSAAMIHAGSNFSHVLAFSKAQGHVLVTSGIYRYVRLPIKHVDLRSYRIQLVSPSVICRLFLLGSGHPTSATESRELCGLSHHSVEVLLPPNQRYVAGLFNELPTDHSFSGRGCIDQVLWRRLQKLQGVCRHQNPLHTMIECLQIDTTFTCTILAHHINAGQVLMFTRSVNV